MKTKRTAIAAALALAVGAGATSQAFAGIYAGSSLILSGLVITFTPSTPATPNPVFTGFTFTTNSDATVIPPDNGTTITSDTCGGSIGAGGATTTCGNGFYQNSGPGASGAVLTSGPAEEGSLSRTPLASQITLRGDGKGYDPDTPAYLGPGGQASTDNYASSDAIIDQSELVDFIKGNLPGIGTGTRQISETELSSLDSSNSNTSIQSVSNLVWDFETETSGILEIEFLADPNVLAEFNDATAVVAGTTAGAGTNLNVTLNGTSAFTWAPTQTGAGICSSNLSDVIGASCLDQTVTENLNTSASAAAAAKVDGTEPTNVAGRSWNGTTTAATGYHGTADQGLQPYYLKMQIDNAGAYSLQLIGKTSADVTRAAPVPATLLLLGGGLSLLAGSRVRRKKLIG